MRVAVVTDIDGNRHMMRHAVATLAYRGNKVRRDAPDGFSSFACGGGCRSAGAILAHISDLLDWALSIAKGNPNGMIPSRAPGATM